jgi:hypothetical protein
MKAETELSKPDFDFTIGHNRYRGKGVPALIALVLVHWRLSALIASLVSGIHWAPTWVWKWPPLP